MRVIAGIARSIPLMTLPGNDTRPTTDRIKETLFNILSADIPACNFLDVFAGSGQIAIEALSRGAASAVLIEQNPKAIDVIDFNLNKTKLADKATVKKGDAASVLSSLQAPDGGFDVIFMDPPYHQDLELRVLDVLRQKSYADDALIIVEASLDTDLAPAEDLGFTIVRCKRYKTNQHYFLRKKA